MKKFKASFLVLILALTPLMLLQSCLNDNDNYYLAIATFRAAENHGGYYFTLDDGQKMYPQQPSSGGMEDGQRVYVYFDILDEKTDGYKYTIEVKGIEKILTKELFVMDEQTADSIGDDKIDITGIWLGDGYLNIRFQFSGAHYPAKPHMVNLVRNDIEGANEEADEEGYLSLEFRHNAFDDSQTALLNGIASFKGPFIEKDLKGLKVRYNSINNGIKHVKVDFVLPPAELIFLESPSVVSETLIAY
ncbi:MAG: NigD-like protein [Mediterranea sp.]|jgi:hypothetical protein|nr:NigD-like protein [Mediterranea sp.]